VGLIASEWDSSLEGDTVSYKFITIEQTSGRSCVGGKSFKAVYFLDSVVFKMNPT
jgi:hypothetical protein